jgi:hypothetical protein
LGGFFTENVRRQICRANLSSATKLSPISDILYKVASLPAAPDFAYDRLTYPRPVHFGRMSRL